MKKDREMEIKEFEIKPSFITRMNLFHVLQSMFAQGESLSKLLKIRALSLKDYIISAYNAHSIKRIKLVL